MVTIVQMTNVGVTLSYFFSSTFTHSKVLRLEVQVAVLELAELVIVIESTKVHIKAVVRAPSDTPQTCRQDPGGAAQTPPSP